MPQWGHSFRPEYLKGSRSSVQPSSLKANQRSSVARFAQEIKAERVVCLTATATSKVADDVCKAFNVDSSCVFRTSPYRPKFAPASQQPTTQCHD